MTMLNPEKPSLAALEPLPLETSIMDIPPTTSASEGVPNSPVNSIAASEETMVVQEDGSAAGAVPDGGLRAWLVVLGGFLDFAIAFGKTPFSTPIEMRLKARLELIRLSVAQALSTLLVHSKLVMKASGLGSLPRPSPGSAAFK